jgi:hypothetical protein
MTGSRHPPDLFLGARNEFMRSAPAWPSHRSASVAAFRWGGDRESDLAATGTTRIRAIHRCSAMYTHPSEEEFMPITPNQGSTGGGTTVTITGTNLNDTTAVRFGNKPATSVTNVSPTEVTAVSPSGSGSVGITVTTPGGTSNPVPFYYVGAPFKQTIVPSGGSTAGGDTVTITGVGLSSATNVAFGPNNAVPTVVSDSQLSVTAPAGDAGPVGVTVTTAGGTNNGLSYTYYAEPTIGAVSPAEGPVSGGTAVTVPGSNLTSTQQVTFGGTPAPFTVISDSTLSAVTPPGAAGPVDVVVVNNAGSATGTDAFTYIAAPGI